MKNFFNKILITLSIISVIIACQSETKQLDPNQYFFDTNYTFMDTTIKESGDTSLFFVYSYENHAEKIYIKKDTIEHRFGSFDEKGTLWVNEMIKYIRNGKIIDSLSQFAYLNLKDDTASFIFFGKSDMTFAVNKYKKNDDSLKIKLVETYESNNKKLELPNERLENHLISVTYSYPIFSRKDSTKRVRQQEAFFDRGRRKRIQSHFKLINDPRIKKLNLN